MMMVAKNRVQPSLCVMQPSLCVMKLVLLMATVAKRLLRSAPEALVGINLHDIELKVLLGFATHAQPQSHAPCTFKHVGRAAAIKRQNLHMYVSTPQIKLALSV